MAEEGRMTEGSRSPPPTCLSMHPSETMSLWGDGTQLSQVPPPVLLPTTAMASLCHPVPYSTAGEESCFLF